jgi:hypothetical protein
MARIKLLLLFITCNLNFIGQSFRLDRTFDFTDERPLSEGSRFATFDVNEDYIILRNNIHWQIYNLSSSSLIYVLDVLNENSAISIHGKFFSIIYGNTVRKYQLDTGVFVSEFKTTENIKGVAFNSENFYFITDKRNLEIRTIASGDLIWLSNTSHFFNIYSTEESIYAITLTDNGKQEFNLIRMDTQRNILWEIQSDRIIFHVFESYPHIFYTSERGITQANINDGSTILHTATGGLFIQDIRVVGNCLYVLMEDFSIIQFKKMTIDYMSEFGYKEKKSTGSYMKHIKDKIFYTHCNISTKDYLSMYKNCKVLQWTLTFEDKTVNYRFSQASQSQNSVSQTLKLSPASSSEINTARFNQRFKSIGMKWAESSLFSPFIIKDVNSSLHLVFYGGAQNVIFNTCNYPALVDIKLTDQTNFLNGSEVFKYSINIQPPSVQYSQKSKFFTLIDYAAALVTMADGMYYIIHGGYYCFETDSVTDLYYITVDFEMNTVFTVKTHNSTVA